MGRFDFYVFHFLPNWKGMGEKNGETAVCLCCLLLQGGKCRRRLQNFGRASPPKRGIIIYDSRSSKQKSGIEERERGAEKKKGTGLEATAERQNGYSLVAKFANEDMNS